MTAIRIDTFGGKIPRVSDRLLPPSNSTIANNCKLFSGELRGWKYPLSVAALTDASPITKTYRIPGSPDHWMHLYTDNIHVLKAPLTNDAYDRVYWSSGTDDIPRYNTSTRIIAGNTGVNAPYRLGMPTPTVTPAVAATGGTAIDVKRFYTFTYVNDFGEEGPPVDPFTDTGPSDATWTVSGLGSNFPTDVPNASERALSAGGSFKRLYRTITGTSGQTTFFFVADIPINTATYVDTITEETVAFNSLLQATGWDEPPAALEGIVAHPNGFLVGFSGNDLYFSEPYRPHAWPTKYIVSTDYPIMGLGVYGNIIGVLTQSAPYSCAGTSPASMSLIKSNTIEPCLSKKGVVTLPNGVYYPSNNGLAFLSGGGASVITQSMLTKDEWQNEYSPETLVATRYGTRYLAYKNTTEGFIFDPSEPRIAIVDLSRSDTVEDIFTDHYDGQVYFLSNNTVYEWDPSAELPPIAYEWQSKVYEFTKPVNLGAAIVKFNNTSFSIDATYIADVEALNADIIASIGVNNSLAAFNTMDFNGTRPFTSYKTTMDGLGLLQDGSVNGSDIVDIAALSIHTPSTAVSVYADGALIYSNNVLKDTMFRLPAGFKAHTYQFKISANTDVYSIAIAENSKGLKQT